MEYKRLGGTDLNVARVGLGCEPLGGTDWGEVDERAAIGAVVEALALGINLFDTADVYGLGKSEERLSQALGERRHDVVIVSKFGVAWRVEAAGGRAVTYRDCSPPHLVEAVEASLRRLRIDCIPIYLVHWPDPTTPLERTLEALLQIRDRGKIRYFGLSNFAADAVGRAATTPGMALLEAEYSLLHRDAEASLLPTASQSDLGFLAYGVLAQGLLSGKYGIASTFGAADRRSRLARFSKSGLQASEPILRRVQSVAMACGKTPSQVAIRWVLHNSAVTSVLVGAKTPSQVLENAAAAAWQLSAAEYATLSGQPSEAA